MSHKRLPWTWVSVGIAWLPVWALYAALIGVAHPGATLPATANATLRIVGPAAVLGFAVMRFVRRHPWPGRFTLTFVLRQVVVAIAYAVSLYVISDALEWLAHGRHALPLPGRATAVIVFGLWLYVMVASLSYAIDSTERAGRTASAAAQTRLAILRAQLQPHFLFNALHAVVHLIPRDPKNAAMAAEHVATLLRTSVEEERNLIPFADERQFVEQYLALEQLRCGDRLVATMSFDDALSEAWVPSFALQTLVENAVRHGVAPQIHPTHVEVCGTIAGPVLTLSVRDTGPGAQPGFFNAGTGLQRLQERIQAMYGADAELLVTTSPGNGFHATLRVPWEDTDAP